MLALFVALAALGVPVTAWVLGKSREGWIFAAYALLMCALPFEPKHTWRLAWAILLAALWWGISPTERGRRWVLCGFVAYLPDLLKWLIPPIAKLHAAMHFSSRLDLGDWISLLARSRWRLHVNYRIFDPYYQLGYVLEILLEGAIFFGSLRLIAGRRSVTDLPTVHHQADAVDK